MDQSVELTLHTLQLHDVFLAKAQLSSNKLNGAAGLAKESPIEIKVTSGVKSVKLPEFVIYMDVEVLFEATVKPPLELSLKVIGKGACVQRDISSEQLGTFAATSGVYLLLPYARMYVATITQLMGYPPLMLPLASIPDEVLTSAAQSRQKQPEPKTKLGQQKAKVKRTRKVISIKK